MTLNQIRKKSAGGEMIMTKTLKYILPVLLVLVLLCGTGLAAPAAEPVTAVVDITGSQVTVGGTTTPDTSVTLLVTRVSDSDKSHMDQTRSGKDGGYAFGFQLPVGVYRAAVTANGITAQKDLNIGNVTVATVTVRAEGESQTLLPQTEVGILEGEATLLEAVQRALGDNGVDYRMSGEMIDSIEGEEGWQWLLNGRGGMALPTTPLQDGDQIVLVDDKIIDPVIAKLSLSADEVAAGQNFTATLHKVEAAGDVPAPGQPVLFSGSAKVTDQNGQATFTARQAGSYIITANTTGSLIRPVPALLAVTGGSSDRGGSGGGGGTDGSITVKMRIEGYRGTILDGYVSFNPDDYKSSDGKYRFRGPEGEEYTNNLATVLLATVEAWNEYGITDNSVGYENNYVARMGGEAEKDFGGKHSTSGWLVRVNNNLINQGVGVWPIKDGDKVEWYYGDVNSYFGTLEVSPTSLKTGEKIKVKVYGQNNGGMGMSNTSRKELMAGATVYVGAETYTTGANGEVEITMNNPGSYEVYAIKLDKDAENEDGGYYFPQMSRTETVRVSVSGTAVGISVPEDPAEAPKIIEEVLANETATAAQVAETVKAAATSLVNGLKDINTDADAAALLDNTAAVTALLDKAAARISGSEAASTFAAACRDIAGVLADLAPRISGEDSQTVLSRTAVQALDAAAKVLGAVSDRDSLRQITAAFLDAAAPILDALDGENRQAVETAIIGLVRQATHGLTRQTLGDDQIRVEAGGLKAKIDSEQAGQLAGHASQTVAELQQKLAQLNLGQDLNLDTRAVIEIPGRGETAVEITLGAGTMAGVAANGASSLTISTSAATFTITPDTFGPEAKDQEITLSAALVDPAGLNNPGVPPGSIVVDLEATAGGQAVTNFNQTLEVAIPYPGTPQNPEAVTVYRIKDDGTLEPMGGFYDPVSGMVKFQTKNFSQYFAKETRKQFTDLREYPWAEAAIETLAGEGIVSGRGNGRFDPGANITRAEFTAIISRMQKLEAPSGEALTFKDVAEGSWYYEAVAAAHANGLVSGSGPDRFNPGGNISREEIAAIIARVLRQKGYQPEGGETEALAGFSDRDQISAWAREGAALAVREGIVQGRGAGIFAPKDKATRAEAAVMLYRLYGLIGSGVEAGNA
jgi:hypothetical protein